jgi:hypothetical protein
MKISALPDAGGMACASLCVAHCLITPALLVSFASVSWLEELEFLFAGSTLLAAVFVTINKPRSKYLVGIWLGVVILLAALYLEDDFSFAPYFLYGGSLLLITSHFLNMKYKAGLNKNCS